MPPALPLHPRLTFSSPTKKPLTDRLKFGSTYLLRWQFALVIVAIVLSFVAILYLAYFIWKKRRASNGGMGKKESSEWVEYKEELRASQDVGREERERQREEELMSRRVGTGEFEGILEGKGNGGKDGKDVKDVKDGEGLRAEERV
jgi:hypothetical protein